jgi:hypothetical protein
MRHNGFPYHITHCKHTCALPMCVFINNWWRSNKQPIRGVQNSAMDILVRENKNSPSARPPSPARARPEQGPPTCVPALFRSSPFVELKNIIGTQTVNLQTSCYCINCASSARLLWIRKIKVSNINYHACIPFSKLRAVDPSTNLYLNSHGLIDQSFYLFIGEAERSRRRCECGKS